KINDSGDVTSQQFSVNNVLALGTVEQVGSAGTLFSDADTFSLTLETGPGQDNVVYVGATAVTTNILSSPLGRTAVRIGEIPAGGGNCQEIQGTLNISSLGTGASANNYIFVDDSQDTTALSGPVTLGTFTPKGDTSWGSITGLAPAEINY